MSATSAAITVDSHPPTLTGLKLSSGPIVSAGNALTHRALGVTAHDGSVLTSVSFYYDSNNDGILNTTATTDTLLGTDSAWPGGWTFTGNAPTTLPASGTVHFFAVVTDSDGTTSATETLTATVDAPPVITTLAATPTSATRGMATPVTLTASGVTDSGGTVKHVRFYFDADNNGILDVGDTPLAAPTRERRHLHRNRQRSRQASPRATRPSSRWPRTTRASPASFRPCRFP